MKFMEKKLLIVDDEAGIREILQFNLENAGYVVDTAASAEEALEKARLAAKRAEEAAAIPQGCRGAAQTSCHQGRQKGRSY